MPVRFALTGGQRGDCPQPYALIKGLPAEVVMADTACDADPLAGKLSGVNWDGFPDAVQL